MLMYSNTCSEFFDNECYFYCYVLVHLVGTCAIYLQNNQLQKYILQNIKAIIDREERK